MVIFGKLLVVDNYEKDHGTFVNWVGIPVSDVDLWCTKHIEPCTKNRWPA